MTAQILNGALIAQQMREQIAADIRQRSKQGFRAPMLAVILVGDNHASQIYVRHKKIACAHVGINTADYVLPDTTSQEELLAIIEKLNQDANVDGILIQLPLPRQINSADVFEAVHPDKDVDGFHPYNLGRLAQGRPYLRPCTPAGIMTLLKHTAENLVGKNATVIGTSNIVGRPMILELMMAGVTVTGCNRKTQDLPHKIKGADIVIVATGCAELIKGEWIKEGSIVIDVGINRTESGKLIGDVEFAAAARRASWITPVPRGVGPMTIASLLCNTLLTNTNLTRSSLEI